MDGLNYKQIKRRKIYEEVAEVLVEMIKSGELKPGDKLDSVEKLATNFQVGRSAIREALTALRAMGLIEMKHGEGTYVREFDSKMLSLPVYTALLMKKEDLKNLLEVRKILEVGAVETAALRRSQDDLLEMEKSLTDMKQAIGNEDLGEQADLHFHLSIAKASKNELLLSLMNNVSEMMVEAMRETHRIWLYSEESTWEWLYEQHKKIYEAIKNKDPLKAKESMLEHLLNVEKVSQNFFHDCK